MSDITKRLGYGGSAVVDGTQVLITSGSFTDAATTSFIQMVSTPPSQTAANRVLHADGTAAYTASLAFDVTVEAMGLFTVSKMLKRWYLFDVGINDGNNSYILENCRVTSLTLNGVAGGLVNASLSVAAPEAHKTGSVANVFIRDNATYGKLVGYWWSGAKSPLKAKSWTLSMTQEATPVYGNLDEITPLYMRVGLVEYALEVESYTPLVMGDSNMVYIETTSFTLVGTTGEVGFQYNGVTELGTYRYAFGTGSDTDASDGVVIT